MSCIKLKILKSLVLFENRRPLLQDGFLFIPGFYEELGSHGPVLDFANLFQNDNPVLIEYCSGNGQWIAAKAKENPDFELGGGRKRF